MNPVAKDKLCCKAPHPQPLSPEYRGEGRRKAPFSDTPAQEEPTSSPRPGTPGRGVGGEGHLWKQTLTLETAGRSVWDIVVVGAGPAGAVAARELARHGQSVLLVDKAAFPRWKVCGCCLTVRAQEILIRLGLADDILTDSAVPLQSLHWAAGALQAVLPLPGWKTLSRECLDAALIAAAVQAGAAFLPETLARPGAVSADTRLVHLRHGPAEMQVRAKIILAADGLGGSFLAGVSHAQPTVLTDARIGAGVVAPTAPAFYEPGVVYMACGASGYLGLVRLEDGRLDLAAALERDEVRRQGGPGQVAAQLLTEAGWPTIPALTELHWRGTPALTRQAATLGAERILLVGDAAGYVEPFTGEGITWALLSALALVPVALRGVQDWTPDLILAWTRRHRQVLARRQGLCRLTARLLRQPFLVRVLLMLLTRLPALSSPVVRYIGTGH